MIVVSVVDFLHSILTGKQTIATVFSKITNEAPHPFSGYFFSRALERALVLSSGSVDETVRQKVGSLLLDMVHAHVLAGTALDDVLYHYIYIWLFLVTVGRYSSLIRIADPSATVRSIFYSIISVLGPMVKSECPKEGRGVFARLETGRNFRTKVMTNPVSSIQFKFAFI